MNHLSIIAKSLVGHTDFVISSGECGLSKLLARCGQESA
jgi:hypothetical protein